MRWLLCLLVLVVLVGCSSSRKLTASIEDRKLTEQTETITQRKGDTVRYEVPNIQFRDTTIVRTNYVTGTTQVLKYGQDGSLTMAECISGAIEEITRSNRELIESMNQKDLESEKEISPAIILYLFIGLAVLVAVAIMVFFWQIRKQGAVVKSVIDKIA